MVCMPDSKKISTRITFDPDLLDWLKAESKRRRMSMSHIIRELVLREMTGEGSALAVSRFLEQRSTEK